MIIGMIVSAILPIFLGQSAEFDYDSVLSFYKRVLELQIIAIPQAGLESELHHFKEAAYYVL